MENPSESQVIAPDAVLIKATNFGHEISKLKDVKLIIEQMDIHLLMNDAKKFFNIYLRDHESFFEITKRVCGRELKRHGSESSIVVFDDAELQNWLNSGDDPVFTVITGALAEDIYKNLAEKLDEKAILESIGQSKDPKTAVFIMKKAKDDFLFFLENLLRNELKNVVRTAIKIAATREEMKLRPFLN